MRQLRQQPHISVSPTVSCTTWAAFAHTETGDRQSSVLDLAWDRGGTPQNKHMARVFLTWPSFKGKGRDALAIRRAGAGASEWPHWIGRIISGSQTTELSIRLNFMHVLVAAQCCAGRVSASPRGDPCKRLRTQSGCQDQSIGLLCVMPFRQHDTTTRVRHYGIYRHDRYLLGYWAQDAGTDNV